MRAFRRPLRGPVGAVIGRASGGLLLLAACAAGIGDSAAEPQHAPARAAASPFTWLRVAGASSANPSIAARGRFVAVAWGASVADQGTDVYVAVSRDGGATFGAPVRVPGTRGTARVSAERPPVVTLGPSATGPDITVVWTAGGTLTTIAYARSRDGGRTFGAPITINTAHATGTRGWVWAAADETGTVHAVWLDHREQPPRGATPAGGGHAHGGQAAAPVDAAEHQHTTTRDGVAMAQGSGIYYAALREGPGGPAEHLLTKGVCYCCRTSIAARGGRVVAAWRHVFTGNLRDIAVAFSADGGRTFGRVTRVREDGWSIEGCPENGPSLTLDAAGAVHLLWPTVVGGTAPEGAIYYAWSGDGRTFSRHTRIPTWRSRDPEHLQLASATPAALAAVWDEVVDGHRVIVLRRLTAGRESLEVGAAVPASEGREGRHPAIAATTDGWAVTWTDGSPTGQTAIAVRRLPR